MVLGKILSWLNKGRGSNEDSLNCFAVPRRITDLPEELVTALELSVQSTRPDADSIKATVVRQEQPPEPWYDVVPI